MSGIGGRLAWCRLSEDRRRVRQGGDADAELPMRGMRSFVRAVVVVSARSGPGECAATLVDRDVWRANGATTLRWTGDRFEIAAARPAGYERPWARGAVHSKPSAVSTSQSTPDAVPHSADREEDD